MRLATIDLGTNTVRFLVVDVDPAGRWSVVAEAQEVTRLGAGLAGSGALGEDAMARTSAVVTAYVDRARALGAAGVRIVATSAVREASNGRAFAAAIQAQTGRPVEIVSGAEEARLTLRGVSRGLGGLPGLTLLVDIGGGSTEYVLARDGLAVHAVSLRLGVVALAERFPFPDRVDWSRYGELARHVAERLARELPPTIVAGPVDRLVGTAGTATTLAALDLALTRYDPGRVQGHALHRAAIERLLARLGALSVPQRAALPCLEPGRADLIIPGIAIVQATLDRVGADALVVSDSGLREGILAAAVEGFR